MHEIPDEDIIAIVLRGNSKAYAMLVKRYQHFVFTLCIKVLKNNELAEEAAQDAFVKAYTALADFSGTSKFSTWLYTIARNTCISRLRVNTMDTISSDDDKVYNSGISNETTELLESKSKKELLQNAIAMLQEEDAAVITLFYIHEQSTEEIAAIMNLTTNNVKVKLYRARKRLKTIMLAHFPREVAAL